MISRLTGRHRRSTHEVTETKWRIALAIMVASLAACLVTAAPVPPPTPTTAAKTEAPTFEKDVQPVLVQVCNNCHNPQLNSGNLNITPYFQASSISSNRDGWAKILAKLKARRNASAWVIPGPTPEAMATLIGVVQSELAKADQNQKPDPGRIIAHRLNRNEYSNTIRDLLGVDFRANEEFPADDSGYGFDNIGDVLTVSPTLMQKYLSAAEQIAARAVGGDPLPKPGFFNSHDRVRRSATPPSSSKTLSITTPNTSVNVNLTGHRGARISRSRCVISVDGKPLKDGERPGPDQRGESSGRRHAARREEVRVFLTANEHTFRAEFVNDEALKPFPRRTRVEHQHEYLSRNPSRSPGRFRLAEAHSRAKKVLICDPARGRGLRRSHPHDVRSPRLPPPCHARPKSRI